MSKSVLARLAAQVPEIAKLQADLAAATAERIVLNNPCEKHLDVNADGYCPICLIKNAVPAGYVMVPKEPTDEMFEAGFAAISKQYASEPLDDAIAQVRSVYKAMIDATKENP